MDVEYVEWIGFWMDMKILVWTPIVVVKRNGISMFGNVLALVWLVGEFKGGLRR